jgi:hypothetical protein
MEFYVKIFKRIRNPDKRSFLLSILNKSNEKILLLSIKVEFFHCLPSGCQ